VAASSSGRRASALRRHETKREGGGVAGFHPNPTSLGGSSAGLPGRNRPAKRPASVVACFCWAPKTVPNHRKMLLPNEALQSSREKLKKEGCGASRVQPPFSYMQTRPFIRKFPFATTVDNSFQKRLQFNFLDRSMSNQVIYVLATRNSKLLEFTP
jgi:hypothetical protein